MTRFVLLPDAHPWAVTDTGEMTFRGRALLLTLFVAYLVLLAWTVLWKLEVPWVGAAWALPRPFKLVPFVASGDAGASAPLEVLANILLFVPFGVYLALIAPRWRVWKAAAVFVAASLLLEVAQHVLSTGSFDITDVIVNAAGGLAGLALLSAVRGGLRQRTEPIVTRVMLIATVVAVIAVVVYIASPLQFHQQRDVVVPRPAHVALAASGSATGDEKDAARQEECERSDTNQG